MTTKYYVKKNNRNMVTAPTDISIAQGHPKRLGLGQQEGSPGDQAGGQKEELQ